MFQLFAVLIFLAVMVASAGAALHRNAAGTRALQDRLRELGDRARGRGPSIDVVRDQRYSAIPLFDRILRRLNVAQRMERMLYMSGLSMRVGQLVLMMAAFSMAGYFIGILVFHRIAPGLLFMAVLAPLPYIYVMIKKGQRMKKFSEEFPDALDLLVSALRAGLSFSAAMQIVAQESPDPVRSEFAVTVEEQALGLEFREAMVNMTQRVDSLDLRFFVTAVILQRDTGGNLAEVLENTSRLIRDRFRVLGDIATFTAQGRLTGWILLSLPLSITVFTVAIAPEYFRPMLETEGGRMALFIAGFMQLTGALIIRKIVNIKA
jgi:tight adherence protein B